MGYVPPDILLEGARVIKDLPRFDTVVAERLTPSPVGAPVTDRFVNPSNLPVGVTVSSASALAPTLTVRLD